MSGPMTHVSRMLGMRFWRWLGATAPLNGGLRQCRQWAAMHSPAALETEHGVASCALWQCSPKLVWWYGGLDCSLDTVFPSPSQ